MPKIKPEPRTVDDVMHHYDAELQGIYDRRTAGDHTFLGTLMKFLIDLSPIYGRDLLRGRVITTEPPACSVVMVHGSTGTAYQRLLSDGLWHSTTGRTVTWDELVAIAGPRGPVLLTDVADSDLN